MRQKGGGSPRFHGSGDWAGASELSRFDGRLRVEVDGRSIRGEISFKLGIQTGFGLKPTRVPR